MSLHTLFSPQSAILASAPPAVPEQKIVTATVTRRNALKLVAPQAAPAAAPQGSSYFHLWIMLLAAGMTVGVLVLAIYGLDYYWLGLAARPLSAKHLLLKPSGVIGFRLGVAGLLAFVGVFAYPLRKRWEWLQRRGDTRNWLDMHVLLGLAAPGLIMLHSAFKFHGFAGMAFWIMAAVAFSGAAGRYLYAQIPRSLSAAELSLQETQTIQQNLTAQLAAQTLLTATDLQPLFQLPAAEDVERRTLLSVLASMVVVDLARPLHVARLRLRLLGAKGVLLTAGGLVPSGHAELESIVDVARRQAALSKRILFLSRSQQAFHLWHVVHRPFSYSLLILAGLHILTVLFVFGVR